jgi:hypothetical protein
VSWLGVLRRIRRRAAKVDASRPLEPLFCGSPGLRLRYFQPHKAPPTRLHKNLPSVHLPTYPCDCDSDSDRRGCAKATSAAKRSRPRTARGNLITIRRAHRYAWPWAVDTAAQTHLPHAHGATKDSAQPGGEAAQAARRRREARGPSLIPSHGWPSCEKPAFNITHHTPVASARALLVLPRRWADAESWLELCRAAELRI